RRLSVDVYLMVGRSGCSRFEGDRNAIGEILKEDGEIGPFKVPAAFESEKRVAARKNGGHGEGAVGIGLIAMEENGVLRSVLGNEENHCAGERLSIFESSSGHGAIRLGEVDDELDGG